jgi:hypothetical protein
VGDRPFIQPFFLKKKKKKNMDFWRQMCIFFWSTQALQEAVPPYGPGLPSVEHDLWGKLAIREYVRRWMGRDALRLLEVQDGFDPVIDIPMLCKLVDYYLLGELSWDMDAPQDARRWRLTDDLEESFKPQCGEEFVGTIVEEYAQVQYQRARDRLDKVLEVILLKTGSAKALWNTCPHRQTLYLLPHPLR